jgi:hypothetical protein
MMPSLFDDAPEVVPTMVVAVERRDRKVRQAADHANQDWMEHARKVVLLVAKRMRSFTTDDVWDALQKAKRPTTHDPRALGPIMRTLHAEGLILNTRTFVPSRRRHATPIPVWERSKPK